MPMVMPTNWDELSSEAQHEFHTKYAAEYYGLYEERIGPRPGTQLGITFSRKDPEATD